VVRGFGPEHGHPLMELVLVDLATGEPLGQDLLGRRRVPGSGASAWSGAWAVPGARREGSLATADQGTDEKENAGRQQRPEEERTETSRPAPATELWSVPEHDNAFFLQARAVCHGLPAALLHLANLGFGCISPLSALYSPPSGMNRRPGGPE
jgi:hypothetical protein